MDTPPREPAADPTKAPGAQTVDTINWVSEQVDFLTNGWSDMQLYASGNLLLGFALATAITAAYTWRKTLASPWLRANRAGGLLKINEALQARLRAAGGTNSRDFLKSLRSHIRMVDRGVPYRNLILQEFQNGDWEAVDKFLVSRPDVADALRKDPAGKIWFEKYTQQRAALLDANVVEILAKGMKFDEASNKLLDFFKKSDVPARTPFLKEFRAIETPDQLQDWLAKPEVVKFLTSPREDVQRWQRELMGLINAEDAAFKDMQGQYRALAKETLEHLQVVDKKGTGIVYMARLVQPELKFEMDRYGHEKFGTLYTLNDGHYGNGLTGKRVHESLVHLDKAARNAHQAARTEHGIACRQRLEALVIAGSALLLGTAGWLLRSASNRRLEHSKGKTGDELVAESKKKARDEDNAKAKDASEPPEVAKRLAEARSKPEETELRDLYALIRKIARQKKYMPAIADRIESSHIVSPETLSVAKFRPRLEEFLDEKNNEAADAVIDAAIAHAAHGRASTVPAIKELLFGTDKTQESFRETAQSLLYPSLVKSLWPSVVPDPTAFPIDEKLFSNMRKESAEEFDKIAGRHRARPPAPRPTDIFPKP